jgi:hypothetical protein
MPNAETPQEACARLRLWRSWDLQDAWRAIARARAFSRGKKRLGVVPVYAEDASEAAIQAAIRKLNFASWEHHA